MYFIQFFLVSFFSLFLFHLSKNKVDENNSQQNQNIKQVNSRYSISLSDETKKELETEDVKLLNSIYFDTIQGFDYGTSNLGISLIGGLSPVSSVFEKGFFTSHILITRRGLSYEIDFKVHYTLSASDLFKPVYVNIQGKLLKGQGIQDLKIGKWTIFKVRITKEIECHQYIQNEENKEEIAKITCNNTSQDLKNKLGIQNEAYITMYANSPNAIMVRIPNKNSLKTIKIHDIQLDPNAISITPFTSTPPTLSELVELPFESGKVNIIGKDQFIYDLTSQFGKPDHTNDLIAVYKIDQDIYNYQLPDITKKKSTIPIS